MTIEISEDEARAILNGLGWAYSEGGGTDDDDAIIEKILKAFPDLREDFKYLL